MGDKRSHRHLGEMWVLLLIVGRRAESELWVCLVEIVDIVLERRHKM